MLTANNLLYASSRKHTNTSVWKDMLGPNLDDVKTGLLIASGMLTREDVLESKEIARSLGRDLFQVLNSSGLVSGNAMELATVAALMVKQNKVSESLAARALPFAVERNMSFEQALSYFGFGW